MKILTISPIDGRKNLVEFTGSNGFSWNFIPLLSVVTIPINQQMVVVDGIEIEGSLDIEGELCLIY
jgi:hypothetical protein